MKRSGILLYKFYFEDKTKELQLRHMVEVFLSRNDFQLLDSPEGADLVVRAGQSLNSQKIEVYQFLKKETGLEPAWGTWTGVKPLKQFVRKGADHFRRDMLVSQDKIDLLEETLKNQRTQFGPPDPNSLSLYIGIPFCPSRCLYCSFTSNQVADPGMQRYLDSFLVEIEAVGRMIREKGLYVEDIYIGGGTPTSLTSDQISSLCQKVREDLACDRTIEWTLEAGRPDTITEDKLKAAKDWGVDRISINPQTLSQKTLDMIGRQGSVEDFYRAFDMAKKLGGFAINCDLIAGLPGEDLSDFEDSLTGVISLEPENITIHSLAVKRASRLIEEDGDFYHRERQLAIDMMDGARRAVGQAGYAPYYIYRQKHTRGDGENIGFSKPGYACLYNVRIMDENQTVVALGAGAVSKKYIAETASVTRVANVVDYELYIERIEEMIDRKARGLF